jgi:hypothetical protein
MTWLVPDWYSTLSTAKPLADLGFRFLAEAELSGAMRRRDEIRVGDVGGFAARPGVGISLILRNDEPDVLYARFADDHGNTIDPEVNPPQSLLGDPPPLVEIALEPTADALADLHTRYVAPGRMLPAVSQFGRLPLMGPDGRVRCHHAEHRRLRIPLGVVGGDDPDDPVGDAEEAIVEIERRLIVNRFRTIYQWSLHTGNYTAEDGTAFRIPFTSADTLFSRSLFTLDCRYSEEGGHLTLEVDYPPEPDNRAVHDLLSSLADHWPDNDLLPADLPFDVIGAIAGLNIAIQLMARMREWLDDGDVSTLISMYFVIAGDDSLTDGPTDKLRAFLTPLAHSPHEDMREVVATMAGWHGLDDLTAAMP